MNRKVMLTLIIIGIPLILGFAADMVQKWDHVFDDAFITCRYARNLAEGHGITWNPGMAPTEGYTNFLLVILLAPFIHLGYDPLLITRLLSYLSVFWMAAILFTRARRRYSATTPTAIMIATLIFLAPSTSDLFLTGLETVVYAFVLLIAFHFATEFLHSQNTINSVLLGIFTLLAVLLRPEAALFYLVMAFMTASSSSAGNSYIDLYASPPACLSCLYRAGRISGGRASISDNCCRIHFISRSPPEPSSVNRTMIANEARRRGIGVEVIDAEGGYSALNFGGRRIICCGSLTELTTAIAMRRCDDKAATRRLLGRAGLMCPINAGSIPWTRTRHS